MNSGHDNFEVIYQVYDVILCTILLLDIPKVNRFFLHPWAEFAFWTAQKKKMAAAVKVLLSFEVLSAKGSASLLRVHLSESTFVSRRRRESLVCGQ